jgi:hypothetical protein
MFLHSIFDVGVTSKELFLYCENKKTGEKGKKRNNIIESK